MEGRLEVMEGGLGGIGAYMYGLPVWFKASPKGACGETAGAAWGRVSGELSVLPVVEQQQQGL